MNFKIFSPLSLPFEEALQPSRFLAQITTSAENQVRQQLADNGNGALRLALASTKFVMDCGKIQVVFEGGIPAGAKLMQSAGKAIPVLVDGKTQRILKVGKVASKGPSLVASAALVVVELAHVISGHDNAKRLKKVDRSVDRLVRAHESELKSRLEAVYRYSKELIADGPDGLSDEDRRELHRQCRDLFELRARWRDDFRFRLGQIEQAKPGWLNILFRRREKALQKNRQQKATESEDGLEVIQLMHFSLMLQMALAGASGKLQAFQLIT